MMDVDVGASRAMNDPPIPASGQGRKPARGGGVDAARVAFWAALALAALAAGFALTAGPAVAQAGAVLLLAIGSVGLVFLVWVSRGGRALGLFPDRGAAEAAAGGRQLEAAVLEAIEEPALLTDRGAGVIAANAAYRRLAEQLGVIGESRVAPIPERLFGADPALSPPMFRLAKAAGAGQRRLETLPPVAIGQGFVRFEASVAPVTGGGALWRFRALAASDEAGAADLRRLFVDDAPIGFFAAQADGVVIHMNRALRSALGWGEDAEPAPLREFLRDDPGRILRRERRGDAPAWRPVTLLSRDGVELRAQALSFWAAEDDGVVRVFVSLGEGQAAEPAAPRPQTADRGPAFFEHAPFGAALLDSADPATALVLDANPALMEMTRGAAAPGARFSDLFDGTEGASALLERLRKAAGGAPIELVLATAEKPTATHVHFTRSADGRGLAYVINVAEQRELEQRLAQSEKMREIGLLAGGVAHDFNNLLQVMINRTHTLMLRHPVGDPDYHDLSVIHDHVLRSKELSEMLRAYARQQTFKVEIMEVSGFVQQMHELARRLCGDAIRAEVKHEPNLPFIKADKGQLERVLVNLVSNARDAMTPRNSQIPSGGTLTLRTGRMSAQEVRGYSHVPIDDGDYVVIEVTDTGCGIKPEDQHKIFHPFHSTKDPTKGTGLGLATSYGIIKQSGGYIFFESKVGKGTTFRIFLPAYAPTPEEIEEMARREREAAQRPGLDVAGRGRILLVEDNDIVRESTAANLRDFGYEIVEAGDGEEALDMLRGQPGAFDLIISDVSMPIMSGTEMIKAAGPEILGRARVLFMTGFSTDNLLPGEYEVSYISKPVSPTQLAQRVKELIAT